MITGIGAVRLQSPEHLDAVDHRQHQIEHHQIGKPGQRTREPGAPVAGQLDFVALARQIAADHLAEVLVVVDDQHPRGRTRRPFATRVRVRHHHEMVRAVVVTAAAVRRMFRDP